MTAEEYSRLETGRAPHIFYFEKGKKKLVYFGAGHIHDNSDDPQYEQIETEFEKTDPELVLVEGIGEIQISEKRKDLVREAGWEEIRKKGENHFTLKLALEGKREAESPEPTKKELSDYLENAGFTRDEIFALRFTNIFTQYLQLKDKPEFGSYMAPYMERFNTVGWENFDFSFQNAARCFTQASGLPLDLKKPELYDHIGDPIPWEGISQNRMNIIARAETIFRDRFMIERIAKGLEKYDRIFAVYGDSHAVMQEAAVKELFSYLPENS